MTEPNDNAKKTGDIHPPDVEAEPIREGMTDALGATGTPRNRGSAGNSGPENRPARGTRKAGVGKDEDGETGASDSSARDSGEGSSGKKR